MRNDHTTTLPIHITTHHLSLSPALRDFAFRKLAKVTRFAGDSLAAEIVLRRHHGTAHGKEFSANARLALPGKDIHARATHANLYTAIVNLVSALSRRARKRNTRFSKSFTPRRKLRNYSRPFIPVLARTKSDKISVILAGDSLERWPGLNARRGSAPELRVFGFRRHSPFSFGSNSPAKSPSAKLRRAKGKPVTAFLGVAV